MNKNSCSIDEYKMIIIPPEGVPNLLDGEIFPYGKKIEYDKHVPCFIDFCKSYYANIPIFQKLTVRHTPEVFAYFLSDLGNIIFLNTTSEVSLKKYGKTGIVFLPEAPSEKQRESLYVLAQEIDDYRISVLYNLSLIDGMVSGNELHAASSEDKAINMISIALNTTSFKSK